MGATGLPRVAFLGLVIADGELDDSPGIRLSLGLFDQQCEPSAFDDGLADSVAVNVGDYHRSIGDGVAVDVGATDKNVGRHLLGLDGRRAG